MFSFILCLVCYLLSALLASASLNLAKHFSQSPEICRAQIQRCLIAAIVFAVVAITCFILTLIQLPSVLK